MSTHSSEHHVSHGGWAPSTVFADLRRRNARAAQVAQMLAAKRKREIEQAIRVQRQGRLNRAR